MAEKKIIDVAGPTDAKVDIGSKPMIVGHKSMASDPMMREKLEPNTAISETAETSPETTPKEAKEPAQEAPITKSGIVEPPSVKQRTIEPLSDVNNSEVNKPTERAPETVVTEGTENLEKPKTDEQVKSEKATEQLDETALELEKEENLRKIIESKKYHVNIKQARGDSKSWVYVLIGIIFTALIALFVLIDAGKLDVGIKLPFSIFGQEKVVKVEETITTLDTLDKNDITEITKVTPTKLQLEYDSQNFTGTTNYGVDDFSKSIIKYNQDSFYSFNVETSKIESPATISVSNVETSYVTNSIEAFDNISGVKLYLFTRIIHTKSDKADYYSSQFGLTKYDSLEKALDQSNVTQWQDPESKVYVSLSGWFLPGDPSSGIGYKTEEEAVKIFESDEFKEIKKVIATLKTE